MATFADIVPHLGKRGYASRKLWDRRLFVYFGMDNVFCEVAPSRCGNYTLCLADICADDWETFDCFWGEEIDPESETARFNADPFQIFLHLALEKMKEPLSEEGRFLLAFMKYTGLFENV